MKTIICLLAFTAISFFSHAQTQAEMNEASYKDYLKADKELKILISKLNVLYVKNQPFLKALKESQRIWLNFRNAEIKLQFPDNDGYGSIYPLCVNSLSEDITRTRIKELKKWLKRMPDGELCSGSIGEFTSIDD